MKEVEHPKVFISYAWSTDEYKEKVRSLASDLMRDGIDVLLDVWDLHEGNDTYAYMETCVRDDTITNVLILLDPIYKDKADNREGGVGVETQIISPELYNDVKQEKFIPIIFERGGNGEICKPVYLKGALHFDLSLEDSYNKEYIRLVRYLYGKTTFRKPELGSRPSWIDESIEIPTIVRTSYNILKQNEPANIKNVHFRDFLLKIKEGILVSVRNEKANNALSGDDYLNLYKETKVYRDEYLLLTSNMEYAPDSYKQIAQFLEDICAEAHNYKNQFGEIIHTIAHELFLYTIVVLLKYHNYRAIAYLFSRTYFVRKGCADEGDTFKVFRSYDNKLHNIIREKKGENLCSGIAQFWIDNINNNICSPDELVFADELCYNVSLFLNDPCMHEWFPLLYLYSDRHYYDGSIVSSGLINFSNQLISKEFVSAIIPIFGCVTINEFKNKLSSICKKIVSRKTERIRYSGRFETAALICDCVDVSKIGTKP